jgi:hypothetical protein
MISRIFPVLALSLGAALVTAQPADDAAAPADTTEQPAGSAATEPASGDDQAGGRQRAPSDYRPSEQISEDLSVSFPVDI